MNRQCGGGVFHILEPHEDVTNAALLADDKIFLVKIALAQAVIGILVDIDFLFLGWLIAAPGDSVP